MERDPRTGQGEAADRWQAKRRAAWAVLAVEAVWPIVFRLLGLVALFLITAWFGLFDRLGSLRLAAVALFAVAAGWILWRARGFRLPSRADAEARLEAANALDHRPLRTQGDRTTGEDAFAAALWREHQRRMAERLRELHTGAPQGRTERLDPFAIRAVLALLLVTAYAYSLGPGGGRVADAFETPLNAEPQVAARIDAWVTPPGYTGRPPLYLTGQNVPSGPVEVPMGSILSVRISDASGAELGFTPDGGAKTVVEPDKPAAKEGDPTPAAPAASGAAAYDLPLRASGRAELSTSLSTLADWRFAVLPDHAPVIAFAGEPMRGRNGTLNLSYTVADDYGVTEAKGLMALKDKPSPLARPLIGLPEPKLSMPRRRGNEAGIGRTSVDLTESPYAGLPVELTLFARDEAGQSARSETKSIVLPERAFRNPMALAVLEQRRILALDANEGRKVADLIDASTLRSEDYGLAAGDYLALQAVRSRILNAKDDDELRSAVDFLWRIALGIEDGSLSDAEKRVKDAQDALSEALKNGASDEEIDKLMAELRQAMQEYMQQLAEQMKNIPPLSQQQMQSGNMQEIRPQDLQRMMDRIENLAKSGSRDAAQQLLAEMQEMMQSLQAARPMQGQEGQSDSQNPMQQQMDKLGELLRRQQDLKNQTFELGRRQMQGQENMGDDGMNQDMPPGSEMQRQQGGQNGDGQQPMTAEELQRRLDELRKQQGQLQKELQQMQEAMKGLGLKPGDGFGEAEKSMGQAEGSLGQGDDRGAVGQQSEAMEALRRGARDMMQQMQQAMGQGQGQGQGRQGQMNGGYGRGEQRTGNDPLGRPRGTDGPDFGSETQVPDEIDTQRARRILDAIRKRLGDRLSPEMEREYLERLLRTP